MPASEAWSGGHNSVRWVDIKEAGGNHGSCPMAMEIKTHTPHTPELFAATHLIKSSTHLLRRVARDRVLSIMYVDVASSVCADTVHDIEVKLPVEDQEKCADQLMETTLSSRDTPSNSIRSRPVWPNSR